MMFTGFQSLRPRYHSYADGAWYYHFPIILLKQSFTILVPLCIVGLSVPCIVFQGSLGKTLLSQEAGVWLGQGCVCAGCF